MTSTYVRFRHKTTGLWAAPYNADESLWWTPNHADAMDGPPDLLRAVATSRKTDPKNIELVPVESGVKP